MAILVGGHPELSTYEGCFPQARGKQPTQVDNSGCPSGKQPSQVDNSGCPPHKKAIIVYWWRDQQLTEVNNMVLVWSTCRHLDCHKKGEIMYVNGNFYHKTEIPMFPATTKKLYN